MSVNHHEVLTDSNSHRVTSSHRGKVVKTYVDQNVRIMSDVWANITYAVVYEPNGPEGFDAESVLKNVEKGWTKHPGMFRRIQIGCSDMYSPKSYLSAEVDANDLIMEIYEAYERGFAFARKLEAYDTREYRAAEARRTVLHGSVVRVTKGRKVAKGTEGIVFWIGSSGWGEKVGLGLPNRDGSFDYTEKTGRYGKVFKSYKNVAWTAKSNVQVIDELGGRVI